MCFQKSANQFDCSLQLSIFGCIFFHVQFKVQQFFFFNFFQKKYIFHIDRIYKFLLSSYTYIQLTLILLKLSMHTFMQLFYFQYQSQFASIFYQFQQYSFLLAPSVSLFDTVIILLKTTGPMIIIDSFFFGKNNKILIQLSFVLNYHYYIIRLDSNRQEQGFLDGYNIFVTRYDFNQQDNQFWHCNSFIMSRKLQIKSTFAVYAIGVTAAMSSFVIGYSHVFLSQMETIIKNKNQLSLEQLALTLTIVVSATNLGEVIGPFMYKWFAQRFGEARAMIYCNVVIIVSVCIQLLQLKLTYLITGRIMLGIVIGILASIIPLYLNSISPLSISGKICSLNQILTCLGVAAAYLLGFIISDDREDQIRWRLMIGFPILPCVLTIIGLKCFFPFDRLERHIERNQKEIVSKYLNLVYHNAQFEDVKKEKTKSRTNDSKLEYTKQLQRYIIAMVAMVSCQLCGINGIFYYAKQLLSQVTDGDAHLSQQLMIGLALTQTFASLICSFLVDLFGRKYLILKGQKILIMILFSIFVVDNMQDYISSKFLHFLIVVLLYLHIITFNFSLGPVGIIYAAQLVPNLTPIIVILRFSTFLVALSTNYIIHEFGIGQLFLMFGVLSTIAHTYLQTRLRETKGKSKPDIYQMFEMETHPDPEEKAALT